MSLEAVLWDMDGTLLDSEKLWDVPLYEFAEKLGGTLSLSTRQAMIGSNVATTMALLFTEVGITPTEDETADGAAWILRRTEELFRAGLPWRPGAQEALRSVRSSGVPMALVTSTERGLTEVALDTIGRDLFDVTVCGDEVEGRNKPLPDPYLKAARLLGVDAAACVAIEDSPTGVASAVAAGCTVLVVPCDVSVPAGERRIFRESLVGVDLEALAALRQATG
ncbi:HAD superfamily hydrolase (TIGR01509 family) [Saccharothrix tamanrassetensis]|uniref:HAD superfamily hydrolase (TIGR01509 family) n=2 Tax=Saccharothrix tamanrassetensis TaxID=1051531 RepID=A0A841C9Q4_9PSEU|nr:HAD family phosphatase [Saccharothrix tamanrassetensis]MBB5954139.1 HAD superfamily hydrolase (TIGR01509 family) [Saccharothrix tamanrassetensis]